MRQILFFNFFCPKQNFSPKVLFILLAFLHIFSSNAAAKILPYPRHFNAQFVSQTVPGAISIGQKYQVSITFRNIGRAPWVSSGGFYLISQNPKNNTIWSINKISLSKKEVILRNRTKTFYFEVTAPSIPGVYNFQWQMYKTGFGFFGEKSPNVSINVYPPLSLDLIEDKTTYEHKLLEFKVTAEGPPNLVYSVTNLPQGAIFDPETQLFSWLPNHGQKGVYKDIRIDVTDGKDTSSRSFSGTVLKTIVFGTIYEKNQQGQSVGLEGVTIQVLDISRTNVLAEGITDQTGHFDVFKESWPDGNYFIKASKPGYKAYWALALIRANTMMPFSVTLADAILPRQFLGDNNRLFLKGILDTHLNYFLSEDVITSSGLPLGAYKESDRGRYNYSNPTEWGYSLLAWVIAKEEEKITKDEAVIKIEKALDTMLLLQNDPSQNYQKLFYPYYYVATRGGIDLEMPYHNTDVNIPSIDNGFLYTSLWILEGWAKANGLSSIENKSKVIKDAMNFRIFLRPDKLYMVHLINAYTGEQSSSKWDIYADEGGVMAWIAYLSGSVTFDEYKELINNLWRSYREWNNISAEEATWFDAMFTWGVRSWSGFPAATWELDTLNLYSSGSFANVVKAHLSYGDWLGVDYPAFSDAMTQPGMTGRYTPPNLPNNVPTDIPGHIVPHAFFVPFCIGPDLEPAVLTALINKISDLSADQANYYHYGQDIHKPFGFEVTASPFKDNLSYGGVESRYIYETLSNAYIIMSLYQGLNINDGRPTLMHFAGEMPGYLDKVKGALAFLYTGVYSGLRVPQDYPTIQAAINEATDGDTIIVAGKTYNENILLNKSGIVLKGDRRYSVIEGLNDLLPVINCENIGQETTITGFTIKQGQYGILCRGTVNYLKIEDNLFTGIFGIYLENGANSVIANNTFYNSHMIWGEGNNRVDIIGNNAYTSGPNLIGIRLWGATALIKDNTLSSRWSGAVNLYANSNADIINNRITSYGWDKAAGFNIDNSTATIKNNLIKNCAIQNSAVASVGLDAKNSTVFLYNNVFYNNNGNYTIASTTRGVAIKSVDTNLVAKNNIFYNNGNGQETVYFSGTGNLDFSYNNMLDNTAQEAYGITPWPGTGNIFADPLFVNTSGPGLNDFHLQASSSCIDAGDPDPQYNDTDGSRNDMGIYGGPFPLP